MLVTLPSEGVLGCWRPELAECGAETRGEPGSRWGGGLKGHCHGPSFSCSDLVPAPGLPMQHCSPSAPGARVLAALPMSDPPGCLRRGP